MRTLNLDPFWRTTIGFDRLFDMMDESLRFEPQDNYPPCNIVRTGEDTYRISLAVAGFKPEQVNVTMHQNTHDDKRPGEPEAGSSRICIPRHRRAPFERRFSLADFVEVKQASFEDGLLQIELERKVPESMRPRKIDITAGSAQANTNNVKTIGHTKAG